MWPALINHAVAPEVDENPQPRPLSLDFEGELAVLRLNILLKNTYNDEPAHVHLWEVTFQ